MTSAPFCADMPFAPKSLSQTRELSYDPDDRDSLGGLVAFSRERLELRHFEVQLLYDAAFLFWGIGGVLAERWAHGPRFGAYSLNFDRLLLTKAAGDNTVVGACGLKASAFSSEEEGASIRQSERFALQWLDDCIKVLQPQHITRVYVKIIYSYPVQARDRIASTLFNEYPGLREFPVSDYKEVQPGITFHARSEGGPHDDLATGTFGLYGSDQVSSLFQSTRPDEGPALGLVYDLGRNFSGSKAGHAAAGTLLRDVIDQAKRDSWDLVTKNLMRVINRVGA